MELTAAQCGLPALPVSWTVSQWHIFRGDPFASGQPLLTLQRSAPHRNLGDRPETLSQSLQTHELYAPIAGTLRDVRVAEGQMLSSGDEIIADVSECKEGHAVAFGGLCASCGAELSDDFMAKHLSSVKHGHREITVSRKEAERIDASAISLLRNQRKLALVLDLDHTLIHTTSEAMLLGSLDGKFDAVASRLRKSAGIPVGPVAASPGSIKGAAPIEIDTGGKTSASAEDLPADFVASAVSTVEREGDSASFAGKPARANWSTQEAEDSGIGTAATTEVESIATTADDARQRESQFQGNLTTNSGSAIDGTASTVPADSADVPPIVASVNPTDEKRKTAENPLDEAGTPKESIEKSEQDIAHTDMQRADFASVLESAARIAANRSGIDEQLASLVDSSPDTFFLTCPPDPARYITKLRPGVRAVLKRLSEFYQMYVYTAGTREYALQVVSLIDPDQELITPGRIVSRDDGMGVDDVQKNLRALFPFDDSMAVILDDRDDVWMETIEGGRRVSPNLVRIAQYHYFRSTGEVNALPGDRLDRDASGSIQTRNEASLDSDLAVAERILKETHRRFYGLPANDAGTEEASDPHFDTKDIIRYLRMRVLHGCRITFSHIIPRTIPSIRGIVPQQPQDASIWKSATAFGAMCLEDLVISGPTSTTHLIAARTDTEKVNIARRTECVFLVTEAWLRDSIRLWQRQPEEQYALLNDAAVAPPGDDRTRLPSYFGSPPHIEELTWDAFKTSMTVERAQRATQNFRPAPRIRTDVDALFDDSGSEAETAVDYAAFSVAPRTAHKRSAVDAFGAFSERGGASSEEDDGEFEAMLGGLEEDDGASGESW